MASAQRSKPDTTQLKVEVKVGMDEWISSLFASDEEINEESTGENKLVNSFEESSSSLLESGQEKNEKSCGFLPQTEKQMKQLAQKATTSRKHAMAKKNDDTKKKTKKL